MTAAVPVLLITGPIGAGKSTVAEEAGAILREAGLSHALVDLDHVGECFPAPVDDPWNEQLTYRTLACLWATYQAAGAERLILSGVLQARSLLHYIDEAVPGAAIQVARLHVGLTALHARIHVREAGRDPRWFLEAATYFQEELERSDIADLVVNNQGRPATETAKEILHLIGWLDPSNYSSAMSAKYP